MGLFDTGENNVGQFGADNSNIIRYKQAAEYAEDARLYALAAAESMTDADNLLNRAEEVLQEARDILAEVQDIEADVEGLEARVAAAEAIANEAIAIAQQAIADTAGIIQEAQGYANAANASAVQAQGFRDTAQNYANSAEGFATQAQGYRDEADGFADEAEQHVAEAETAVTDATTQANRAKSEADRAAEIVAGIPGKETIDGFAKVYRNKTDADADVNERTVGDKVLVWDADTSVYTWYDVTGTTESKALTLNSTEKKLKTINNVAPDDSGNVQITLPSGNPSLWLGETVFFQYDPDQPITYPGLLAQDGKEYNREDYPDLWNAINLGYVPSVSETDWQAGKKNAFSTGNGTSTFRVPLFSGEALRTPNFSDTKGSISAQVPYVVSVNGILPDDTTGNVAIDLSSYAKTSDVTLAINNATSPKANKGANTDITSLSGLTTPLSVAQGGTGANTVVAARNSLGLKGAAILDVGTSSGTVAAGNDSRLDTVDGKTGGTVGSAIRVNGALTIGTGFIVKDTTAWATESGSSNGNNVTYRTYGPTTSDYSVNDFYVNSGNFWSMRQIMVNNGGVSRVWEMRSDNSFRSPGTVYAAGTALTSDARLKSNFEDVKYDLDIIDNIKPQYYDKRIPDGDVIVSTNPDGSANNNQTTSQPEDSVRELGIVAQKLQKVIPGLVSSYYWNEKYPDLLSINYSGLSAWLVGYVAKLKDIVKTHEETISEQKQTITELEARIARLEVRMHSVDGMEE